MIRTNYHTHTSRCGHAIGSDKEYVKAALKAGLKTLGFSDHTAYREQDPAVRMSIEQVPDYIASIRSLQKKYAGEIQIFMGMEAEFFPSQWDTLQEYRKTFDYIILGQHDLSFRGKSSYEIHSSKDLDTYVHCIEEACRRYFCDCIAHPDLALWDYPVLDSSVTAAAERIADISLYYDIPLELNTGSGVKYGKRLYPDGERYAYPTRAFFEVFAKKKCPVIIGLDVHDPAKFLDDRDLNRALSVVENLPLRIIENYDLPKAATKRKQLFQKNADQRF